MTMNLLADLPIEKLKHAVELRERIEALQAELDQLTGVASFLSANGNRNGHTNGHGGNGHVVAGEKRRELTAAGRARIAAAQRLRWSKYNASRPAHVEMPPRETRLSTEGRARVAAAVRARWDRFRAAKARALRRSKRAV